MDESLTWGFSFSIKGLMEHHQELESESFASVLFSL